MRNPRRFAFLFLLVPAILLAQEPALDEAILLFDALAFEEAQSQFQRMMDSNPGNIEAGVYLGRTMIELGDHDAAIKQLQVIVDMAPEDSEAHHWLAHAYVEKTMNSSIFKKKGLAGHAKEHFTTAVDLAPDDVEARSCLASFYREAPGIAGGSMKKAREQINEIKLRNLSRGCAEMAQWYIKDGDEAGAEREFLRWAEWDKRDPEPYYQLGMLFQSKEQWADARGAFDTSLSLDPDYLNSLYQIGRTAVLSGQDMEAGVVAFTTYLEREPGRDAPSPANAHWRLGMLFAKMGRADDARTQFEAALGLEPEHEGAREGLKD